ncbi:MAG: N-acetyltransferase [candidate division KSB1 bacterium]|nr:N-acetyltransferase [candidate division KSB1 bacterium]
MIRRAKIHDVPQIVQLIKVWSDQGEMLPVAQSQVFSQLRSFVVVEQDEKVIGVGALVIIWGDLAEVRSLALKPEAIGQGIGREIVSYLLDEAKELEIPRVFTLTYKPEFFQKLGFSPIDKKYLPHKVWKDCINCPKFPDCDENALIIDVN